MFPLAASFQDVCHPPKEHLSTQYLPNSCSYKGKTAGFTHSCFDWPDLCPIRTACRRHCGSWHLAFPYFCWIGLGSEETYCWQWELRWRKNFIYRFDHDWQNLLILWPFIFGEMDRVFESCRTTKIDCRHDHVGQHNFFWFHRVKELNSGFSALLRPFSVLLLIRWLKNSLATF